MESHDEVIFTLMPPRKVYARFLSALRLRWPGALFSVGWNTTKFIQWSGPKLEKLLARRRELFVVRDREMEEFFLKNAFLAGADGEGAFGVLVRERRDVIFKLGEIDQLQVRDPGLGKVDPYPGWLCSPSVWEVTVMTVEDPAEHEFSKWVFDAVVGACVGRVRVKI